LIYLLDLYRNQGIFIIYEEKPLKSFQIASVINDKIIIATWSGKSENMENDENNYESEKNGIIAKKEKKNLNPL